MLNELSLRQLKYISDNLESCSKIIKSAVKTRTDFELMSGNTVKVAKEITQKENPSDFYKFRYFTTEIFLHYEKKQYFICFSGLPLDNLHKFFDWLNKKYFLTEFNFNDIRFDNFGIYMIPILIGDFETNVSVFRKFVACFISWCESDTTLLF